MIDLFGNEKLRLVEESRHRAAGLKQIYDSIPDNGIVAAEDRRTTGLKEINVLIPVFIVKVSAFGFTEAYRERLVESQVVLYSTRNVFLSFFIYFLRL